MTKIENALAIRLRRFKEYGAGAIAEQNTGVAVLVIDDRTHYVATYHQRFLVGSGPHELRAYRQRIHKSRTGSRKIETPGACCPNPALNETSRRREKHVR